MYAHLGREAQRGTIIAQHLQDLEEEVGLGAHIGIKHHDDLVPGDVLLLA